MKGGKQPGAGRPPGPPTITVRIRLSPAQHAAYVERGSEHWLKRVLSEVNENQTEKKNDANEKSSRNLLILSKENSSILFFISITIL